MVIYIFIEKDRIAVELDGGYIYLQSIREESGYFYLVKHKYCNKISKCRKHVWDKGSRPKCCCRYYENSIAYHIECELGLNLYDIWNWKENDKNGINPYEIYKSGKEKIWVYCQKHDYHNYDKNNNKKGYNVSCNNFYYGKRCTYCSAKSTHYKDSLAYNYLQIAKTIAIEENSLTLEDCYNIAPRSNKKFYFKCSECGYMNNKKKSLDDIVKYGIYHCQYCGDGISIPEKFTINILNQLNINFVHQLTKKDFDWCNTYIYDFYIQFLNMIIETHGIQHYEKSRTFNRRSLHQEQMNDLFKYKCAEGHVDNYIVIDCSNTNLRWLKENTIKELSPYFDLSKVDWELAWEESQNSLCIKTWKLYNEGKEVKEICNKLNICYASVYNYLRIGRKIGKCNYKK